MLMLMLMLSHQLQVLIPMFTELIPSILTNLPLFLGTTCRFECYVACCLYSWMPVLNPLMALIFIRHYRAYVLNWMVSLFGSKKIEPISATGMVVQAENSLRY